MVAWILPTWRLPNSAILSFGTIIKTIASFNLFFPIHTLLEILGWIMLFEISIIIIRFAGGLISYIRGGGAMNV